MYQHNGDDPLCPLICPGLKGPPESSYNRIDFFLSLKIDSDYPDDKQIFNKQIFIQSSHSFHHSMAYIMDNTG